MAASAGLEEGVPSETVAPSLSLLERLRMVVPAAQTEENHWLMGAAIFPKDRRRRTRRRCRTRSTRRWRRSRARSGDGGRGGAPRRRGERGEDARPAAEARTASTLEQDLPRGRVRLYCKATATASRSRERNGRQLGHGGHRRRPGRAGCGGGTDDGRRRAADDGEGVAAAAAHLQPRGRWAGGAREEDVAVLLRPGELGVRARRVERDVGLRRAAAARSTAARSPPPASRRRGRAKPRRR